MKLVKQSTKINLIKNLPSTSDDKEINTHLIKVQRNNHASHMISSDHHHKHHRLVVFINSDPRPVRTLQYIRIKYFKNVYF